MKELGYYNGRIGELSEMQVPMSDRVSWFGDGVYDAGLCRNYHIFCLDEHVDRLFRSASMLDITPPVSKEELKEILRDLVRKMDTGDLFVYYQITRGGGKRTHAFPEGKANLWVTLTPRKPGGDKTPVAAVTTEDTRFLHCNIKTLNLIPSVMAAEKAKRAGAYESIFYRAPDRVTEGAHSNVHILKDGEFHTAPLDNLILPGTVRAHLIAACRRLGIPVYETPFTLEELRNADEIFVTNSGDLMKRVGRLDGKEAGLKSPALFEALHKELFDEFYEETGGKD